LRIGGAVATPATTTPTIGTSASVTLSLDATSYSLALQQSVTVVATVTGTSTPVAWMLDCETGQASIVARGDSATLTGLGGGTCFLSATEGQLAAFAIVRIPPLAVGDSCTDDSQCSQDAPRCGSTDPSCDSTCTMACTTQAECPISDAFGNHVPCISGLCRLIRNPGYSCE
jgi:hypothetical protein